MNYATHFTSNQRMHSVNLLIDNMAAIFSSRKLMASPKAPPQTRIVRNLFNHPWWLENNMVRPWWGATSNGGWELTRGCYAFKQKYHLPSPPPVAIFFAPTSVPQSDQRDEAAISSHICRGPDPPTPPLAGPLTPPPPPPKTHPPPP